MMHDDEALLQPRRCSEVLNLAAHTLRTNRCVCVCVCVTVCSRARACAHAPASNCATPNITTIFVHSLSSFDHSPYNYN